MLLSVVAAVWHSVWVVGQGWYYSGWSYRRSVTITNNTTSVLTDYQVLVNLSSTNFDFSHAKTDGSDIRFAYWNGISETEIPYWIEQWDSGAQQAKVWVKVPSVPANGNSTIYLYYGNPTASSASNGNATFLFFDDFEDGVISSPWNKVQYIATITEANGHLEAAECGQYGTQYCVEGYAYAYVDLSAQGFDINVPFRIRFKMWDAEDNEGGERGGWALSSSVPSPGTNVMRGSTNLLFYVDDANNRLMTELPEGWCLWDRGTQVHPYGLGTSGGWFEGEFRRDPSGNILWYFGGELKATTAAPSWSSVYFVYGEWDTGQSSDATYLDNLIVSKYTDPEPTAAVGAEEQALTNLPDLTPLDISFLPETPKLGQAVTIMANIRNSGVRDARSVLVRFFDGDPNSGGSQIGDDQVIDVIASNGTALAQVNWVAMYGTNIYVIVDPMDTIPESNEGNNQSSKALSIIIETTYRPSINGFAFGNWPIIDWPIVFGGHCLGMSATSLLYYLANWPLDPRCNPQGIVNECMGGPAPPRDCPNRIIIEALQWSLTPHAIASSLLPVNINEEYERVRSYLSQGWPTILAIPSSPGIPPTSGHALVAYKIEEGPTRKRIYVYDPNFPADDAYYLGVGAEYGWCGLNQTQFISFLPGRVCGHIASVVELKNCILALLSCPDVTATSSPQRVTFRRANQQATIYVTIRNNSGARRRTVTAITPQADEPFTIVRISPSLPRTINNRSSRTFTVTVRGPAVGPFPIVVTQPYFDTALDCGVLTTATEPRLLVPLRVEGIQAELHGDHVFVEARGEGIASVQLQLFDLNGKQLLNQASNTTMLTLPIMDSSGQPLANGVYLYVVRVQGYDGQEYVSEIRKLVIVR